MHQPIYLCFYLGIAVTNQSKFSVPISRISEKYFIWKNVKALFIKLYVHPPRFFPTHPDFSASHIGCTSDDEISNVLKFGRIYSLHHISSWKVHIVLQNTDEEVQPVTKQCFGIKCCSASRKVCSTSHHEVYRQQSEHNTFTLTDSLSLETDYYKLAKQVFLYAQLAFSLHCRHEGNKFHVDNIEK